MLKVSGQMLTVTCDTCGATMTRKRVGRLLKCVNTLYNGLSAMGWEVHPKQNKHHCLECVELGRIGKC